MKINIERIESDINEEQKFLRKRRKSQHPEQSTIEDASCKLGNAGNVRGFVHGIDYSCCIAKWDMYVEDACLPP